MSNKHKQSLTYVYGIVTIAITRWLSAIGVLCFIGYRWVDQQHVGLGTLLGGIVGLVIGGFWWYHTLKQLQSAESEEP